MGGRLTSHRFRRRLLWIAAVGVPIGGIAAAAIAVGNTGKSYETPINKNGRAWVYHQPPPMALRRPDRLTLFQVSSQFVQTAVVRKHLDSAWSMLGPEMRAGQTRKSWDTGFNNVVPFPAVGIAAWKIDYSFRDDVAIDVALIGAKTSDWAGKTFTLELKRYPAHPNQWLVASWTPRGVGGAHQIKSAARIPPPPRLKPPLSAKWLLVPVVIFGSLIVGLILWGIRTNLRNRRAARRYAEVLAGVRSSSNPS